MQRLKEIREKKKLSQAELAKLLNISSSAVGMYEQNRRFPKDENMLKAIAGFFNVSIDYLLGLTDIPEPIDTYIKKSQQLPAGGSLQLSADEQAMIKKYRALDQRGKDTVDDTLQREYRYTDEARRAEVKDA